MNNKNILENKPEGATHIDNEGDYLKLCDGEWQFFYSGDWDCIEDMPYKMRSISDIERIVQLEEENEALKVRLKEINDMHFDCNFRYSDTKDQRAEDIAKACSNWLRKKSGSAGNEVKR